MLAVPVRKCGESNEQTVDCSRRHNRVAVQQHDRRASARTNADVVAFSESEVAAQKPRLPLP